MMYQNFEDVMSSAMARPRCTVAIAAATDEHIVELVDAIGKRGLCSVIMVGDRERITEMAQSLEADISYAQIVDEQDADRSALTAVRLVSEGCADILVKGKINTSNFLKAVLDREIGLRSGRRLSTLSCYDVPGEKKLFFITDGGMNIAPDLELKADILRNAVEALHSFGVTCPKVALLAANEKVSSSMPATVDASNLVKMAERGELPLAIYEGPIAFDVAMREEAAQIKGISSRISGDVDLFLVHNIETGNSLGKAIGYFGHGKSAVLVVGARRPIVMTSRSASVENKLNTIAFAILACDYKENK